MHALARALLNGATGSEYQQEAGMASTIGDVLDFSGKVVLITGAATGIGRAVAVGFASRGAKVAIGDINEEAARETLDLVKQAGGEVLLVPTNVSDEADVEKLVAATVKRFGQLDCAFNNAGVVHAPQSIAQLDASVFDRVISVDLRGVFLCMKYELREMVRAGHGAIVNTASVAGFIPEIGEGAYVAAKHGVIGLTKTAAIENAHLGVRVNVLAPGWVRTPLTTSLDEDQGLNEQLKAAVPMHRGAEPEEMVGMVLFLCSDAASYVTGQPFVADGGQMIRGLLPVENRGRAGRA
jgi:NAD(P)-dependent dehydrogenase (short-subunit alcohol dehydrogenase family)